ncbi:MAG: PorV/PorQ family protein [Candidatus Saganbacteria bacterium]|nr:PorV/PorQ family protein [Candidatus Saganbacteria bacterium]
MKRLIKYISYIIIVTAILSQAMLFAATYSAIDPSYVGVGARSLGMGKTYVAIAEDAESIFMNPAGLGRMKTPKLTSMYSSLMGDVSYAVLGGTYPLEVGSIGLGYVGSRVDNIWVLGSNAASSTHYPTPTSIGGYSNNVLFLSYGFPLEVISADYGKNIYLGANLKYFDQTASGTDDASSGNGRGVDLDLGILYTPNSWLSFGLNQQNILPANMGGAITYKSGIEEGIPSTTKIGTKVNLLGRQGKALIASPVRLNLAADSDLYLQSGKPAVMRFGAELWPIDILAIRMGLDQDPVPGTVGITEGRNLTYGIGLRLKGIEFDYAYHPYSGIQENATHYFSISFVGDDPKEEKNREYITIIKPRDKLITRRDYVKVSGIVHPIIDQIQVNGIPVPFDTVDGSKTFRTKVPLEKAGKRLVVVEGYDKNGVLLESKRIRIIRLATFSDVTEDFWAVEPIEYTATAGIAEGYPDGTFQPNRILSRAELATLLVRTNGVDIKETIEKRIFPDLNKSDWATRYVDAANEMGLVVGYPDKTFKPDKNINRMEGVTVASRFDSLDTPQVTEKPYKDVSKKSWAANDIDAAKQKGLIDNSSIRFEPKRGLTRAEAVEILSKTDFGTEKIDYLLDWNKGYGKTAVIEAKNLTKYLDNE